MNNDFTRNQIPTALKLFLQGFGLNNDKFFDFLNTTDSILQFAEDLKQQANNMNNFYTFSSFEIAKKFTPIVVLALNYTDNFIIKDAISSPKGKWSE